jgi:hypothetical protein
MRTFACEWRFVRHLQAARSRLSPEEVTVVASVARLERQWPALPHQRAQNKRCRVVFRLQLRALRLRAYRVGVM